MADQAGWSVTNLKAFMIIKWASLVPTLSLSNLSLGRSDLSLNNIISLLNLAFPAVQIAGSKVFEGVPVDLVQFTADFGINEIPTATCSIPLGRSAANTSILSVIHLLVRKLKLFLGASIYLSAEETSFNGEKTNWPNGPFRVFDGFITGTGWRKTTQSADFQITMTHWLSNLNFSSTLSRSSSPQFPDQTSFPATLPIFPNGGVVDKSLFRNGAPLKQAGPIIAPSIQTDFWGQTTTRSSIFSNFNPAIGIGGLKGWFTELSSQDRINWEAFTNASALCGGRVSVNAARKNVEALAALSKIEPGAGGYQDGVPLKLWEYPERTVLGGVIGEYISQETPGLYAHTIWDKLAGQYARDFCFSIIPQVDKAMVVPFTPFLRKPWVTIKASEYDFIETTDNIPRPLRGVALFCASAMRSGYDPGNKRPTFDSIGAYYENPNRRNGLVIFKKAPLWLANTFPPSDANFGGAREMMSTSGDARAGQTGTNTSPARRLVNMRTLWCDYARSLYIQEVLRGRGGRLSGKLRFDICPGSIIAIEDPEDPFVLQMLGQSQRPLSTAQCVRVSILVNSESQKAGTSIQFAFTRDEDENKDDSFSLNYHPLWSCVWYGAPLAQHPAFYPENIQSPSCPTDPSPSPTTTSTTVNGVLEGTGSISTDPGTGMLTGGIVLPFGQTTIIVPGFSTISYGTAGTPYTEQSVFGGSGEIFAPVPGQQPVQGGTDTTLVPVPGGAIIAPPQNI